MSNVIAGVKNVMERLVQIEINARQDILCSLLQMLPPAMMYALINFSRILQIVLAIPVHQSAPHAMI